MRLPNTEHTSRPWRIHQVTADFRLEDVWALPTPGHGADFRQLVDLMTSADAWRAASGASRALWAIRRELGRALGWDRPETGVGTRVATLADRLPDDLRNEQRGPDLGRTFSSLYLLDDEWALEAANQTMHGVLHLGWVPDGRGGYRGQMAILTKPNGTMGRVYMAAIAPFRYGIVYPAMLRAVERAWRARAGVGERVAV